MAIDLKVMGLFYEQHPGLRAGWRVSATGECRCGAQWVERYNNGDRVPVKVAGAGCGRDGRNCRVVWTSRK